MAGEDFVHVKLSRKGEELAGSGELVICNHLTWRFKAGQVQRLPKAFDWEKVLSKETMGGEALFELSPRPPKTGAAGDPTLAPPRAAAAKESER